MAIDLYVYARAACNSDQPALGRTHACFAPERCKYSSAEYCY